MVSKIRVTRKEVNRLLGVGTQNSNKRKPLIPSVHEFPTRFKSLGKSSKSEQGVGGWRSNYYRATQTPVNDGVDYRQTLIAQYEANRQRKVANERQTIPVGGKIPSNNVR